MLIDLIGYRRFGHNEADEPAYTQPEMYQVIKKHPPVRELFAKQLIDAGRRHRAGIDRDDRRGLGGADRRAPEAQGADRGRQARSSTRPASTSSTAPPSPEVKTAVSVDRLRVLNEELLSVPDGFTVHPKLVKQLEQRREALGEAGGIIWAHAEALAFASLLTEGIPIRLTGQDTERGTFSQRHLVLHDPKTGQEYCAMQHLPGALAPMELHNSPLSEMACLGFEYGYSQEGPETLVLWEAQFGDFVNGAQVIIDQFIVSGLAKWGQTSRLTLLLPHGYEGSGPEHSSARLERFLQLAAEGNIRVANPTTPAQYFHLLRRQARIAKQRPLVIMTPEEPAAAAAGDEPRSTTSPDGRFQPVLAEPGVDPEQVTRLILCSGKIYYDLVGHADRAEQPAGRGRARRAAVSVPAGRDPRSSSTAIPNLTGGRLGPGGAAQHGRPRPHVAAAAADPARAPPLRLHRPARARRRRARATRSRTPSEQNRIVATALDLAEPVSQYPRKLPGER